MISSKRHNADIKALYDLMDLNLKKQAEQYEVKLSKEYGRAKQELGEKMRDLLRDFNWEVFHQDASTLKPRVLAFISEALNEFHERAI